MMTTRALRIPLVLTCTLVSGGGALMGPAACSSEPGPTFCLSEAGVGEHEPLRVSPDAGMCPDGFEPVIV